MYSMMLKKNNLKNFKVNLRLVFNKIKKRWGIESNFQVFIIFSVFAFTGASVLLAKNIIYAQLGVSPDWAWYTRLCIWIFIVLPTYYVLLIFLEQYSVKRNFLFILLKNHLIGCDGKKNKINKNGVLYF